MTAKKTKAKPPADAFTVNDDGTIDLRIKGEMHYLRCPTVGELQKIVVLHAGLVKELGDIAGLLAGSQQAVLDLAKKVADGDAEPEALDDLDQSETLELLMRQRQIVADFWADEVIGMLGDTKLAASDLPAFLSHPGSIGEAVKGWYGLPSGPGGG